MPSTERTPKLGALWVTLTAPGPKRKLAVRKAMGSAPTVGLGQVFTYQVAGQLVLVALVAVALFAFYRVYQRRYLLHWGLSWAAQAVYLVGAAATSMLARLGPTTEALRAVLSLASMAGGYLQVAWLLLGTWELAGRRDSPRRVFWWATAAGLTVGAVSLIFAGASATSGTERSLARLGIRWLFASAAYLAAALGVLWSARRRSVAFGCNMMGVALAACGLDQAAYLVLVLLPGPTRTAQFGLMGIFDLAAMAALGLAVVIWLLEDERERMLHAVQETERRQRAQTCVYRISEAAHSVRDLRELFRSIHAIIAEAVPVPNFYIALFDRESKMLSFPYYVDQHDTPPDPMPLGHGLTEYVLRTRKPLLAGPEVFGDLEAWGEVEAVGSDSVDWLGVPLLSNSEAIGVLAVQTYDPGVRLGREEQELLVFVSEQVAAAIEAKRAEEGLRLGEARLRQVINLVPHFIFAKDVEGRFLLVNRAVAEAYGTTVEELLGRTDADFARSQEEVDHFRADDLEVIRSAQPKLIPEEPITDSSGRVRYLQTIKIPFTFSGSTLPAILGVSLDITERKAAEQALLRAAKEESLSVLAGGVAHDFNNLLAAILGHVSLAVAKVPEGDPSRNHIEKAAATIERAANLTRQMLAYSGRGTFVVKPTDLGTVIRDTLSLLDVGLPKRVRVVTRLAEGLPPIEADEGQLEQVVMNLVINGAEALGDQGGTVTVGTGLHPHNGLAGDAWELTPKPLASGDYVMLEVADDGPGMDAEIVERIFDPFFSTKFTGRGLGLAAVLGIMRGHGGGLAVESGPGRGTAFRLLFPPSQRPLPAEVLATASPASGRLAVLVIDDEGVVRDMVAEVLEYEGFEVYLAADGRQGIEILRHRVAQIDAVLLDLSMPGLSGEETFPLLLEIRPDLPVILSSGYDNAEVARRFAGAGPAGFIQKPYRPAELVSVIRRCVAARKGGSRGAVQ